jgi:hypothetical protein
MATSAVHPILSTSIALGIFLCTVAVAGAQSRPNFGFSTAPSTSADAMQAANRRPSPQTDPGSPESQPEQNVEHDKNAVVESPSGPVNKPPSLDADKR